MDDFTSVLTLTWVEFHPPTRYLHGSAEPPEPEGEATMSITLGGAQKLAFCFTAANLLDMLPHLGHTKLIDGASSAL